MGKKNTLNKTVTQVKDMPIQVMSAGMTEADAMAAQKEIAKRLTDSFSNKPLCEVNAMKLAFIMLQHNIVTLQRLCEIVALGSSLMHWEKDGTLMISPALLDIMEKKPEH